MTRRCCICDGEMVRGQTRPGESKTHFALRRTCGRTECTKALRRERCSKGSRLDHATLANEIRARLDRGLNLTTVSVELEISMQTAALICERFRIVRRTYDMPEDLDDETDTSPPPLVSPRQVREYWQTPLCDRRLFAPEVRRMALEVGP